MPRKSIGQREMEALSDFLPGGKAERPPPPAKLSAAAAAVWEDAVSSMKARHFTRETHALLTRYCNASALCARLEVQIDTLTTDAPDYDRLVKLLNATAMTALSYARALRLTPRSNLTRAEARDPSRTTGPKPWELSGDAEYDEYGNRPRKPWLD